MTREAPQPPVYTDPNIPSRAETLKKQGFTPVGDILQTPENKFTLWHNRARLAEYSRRILPRHFIPALEVIHNPVLFDTNSDLSDVVRFTPTNEASIEEGTNKLQFDIDVEHALVAGFESPRGRNDGAKFLLRHRDVFETLQQNGNNWAELIKSHPDLLKTREVQEGFMNDLVRQTQRGLKNAREAALRHIWAPRFPATIATEVVALAGASTAGYVVDGSRGAFIASAAEFIGGVSGYVAISMRNETKAEHRVNQREIYYRSAYELQVTPRTQAEE